MSRSARPEAHKPSTSANVAEPADTTSTRRSEGTTTAVNDVRATVSFRASWPAGRSMHLVKKIGARE